MGRMIIPNKKEMDEIKSIQPSKWSLIKNLSDFIKTLGLENKNLWAPLDNTISSDLTKVETYNFSSWKLLAFNNFENKSMKVKRKTVDKKNDLIKDFQEKEQSWVTVKSQDEIIFGGTTGMVNFGNSMRKNRKDLKSLVKEIIEDLKINYPIIVVQERKEEYLWGFYYNPKNWSSYEKVTLDGVKEYNTIIKFAIPLQTTQKNKESGIYIMAIPIKNRKPIHNDAEFETQTYSGFYATGSTQFGSANHENAINIFKVLPQPNFLNWNISPFDLK
ncbi:MAG: hypothetical protein ACW98X_07595 [Promethearchaeota archaeon]|jgi:hypothetical protein